VASASSALASMIKAAQAEEVVRKPPEATAATPGSSEVEARARADQGARRLLACLNAEGGIRQELPDALNVVLTLVQELRTQMTACKQIEGSARDALAAGENAVRLWCERPARQLQAVAWLAKHGLLHCVLLLQARSLLERLPEVAAKPELAEGAGLPRRAKEAIVDRAVESQLSDIQLAPRVVPAGWRRAFSRSIGMEYFIEKEGSQQSQWIWPVVQTMQFSDGLEEPAPPKRPTVGEPIEGAAVYVEIDLTFEPHCLLCGVGGRAHLAGKEHLERRTKWRSRLRALEALLPELRLAASMGPGREERAASPEEEAERRLAVETAWRGEMLKLVAGAGAGDGGKEAAGGDAADGVTQALWHLVVRPRLPEPSSTFRDLGAWRMALIAGLEAMLAAGSLPEPNLDASLASEGVAF